MPHTGMVAAGSKAKFAVIRRLAVNTPTITTISTSMMQRCKIRDRQRRRPNTLKRLQDNRHAFLRRYWERYSGNGIHSLRTSPPNKNRGCERRSLHRQGAYAFDPGYTSRIGSAIRAFLHFALQLTLYLAKTPKHQPPR
jgi:hypothetical protein